MARLPMQIGDSARRLAGPAFGDEGVAPDERIVANSIVSSATSRRAKQSSGAASMGGWLWAIPAANAIQESACSTCKSWGAS
jgi:hypothetical protein